MTFRDYNTADNLRQYYSLGGRPEGLWLGLGLGLNRPTIACIGNTVLDPCIFMISGLGVLCQHDIQLEYGLLANGIIQRMYLVVHFPKKRSKTKD